jgi:hypothetical protein
MSLPSVALLALYRAVNPRPVCDNPQIIERRSLMRALVTVLSQTSRIVRLPAMVRSYGACGSVVEPDPSGRR